jgi:MFS family permease
MKFTSLLVDIGPLKESPAFRRLWMGTGLSTIGSQMTVFAVVLQVYTLTGTSLAVGVVGLFVAVPSILFGLLGGTIADAFDRRTLVLATSSGQALVSVVFTVQAFTGLDQLWLLYLLVAIQSLLGSVGVPARRTLLPRLLPKEQLPAGFALTLFTMHLSQIAGPAIAGVVAATWGLTACYFIDALSFAAALYGIARLPAMPPEGTLARPGLRAVGEALRFIRGNRVLTGAFLADLSITVLGVPTALFPAINAVHFGGGAQTLGLLTTATAVGGLLGTAFSGPVGRVSHQGRATIIACVTWGVAVAGFGLTTNLWSALTLLVIAGTFDVVSVTFCQTIVQVTTPDHLRGRVTAAEHVVSMGGPQLGNFRAGAVGSLTSPAIGAVSGGLASIAGALLVAVTVPAFVRYQARTEENTDGARVPGATA